jgi:hypothetical protein
LYGVDYRDAADSKKSMIVVAQVDLQLGTWCPVNKKSISIIEVDDYATDKVRMIARFSHRTTIRTEDNLPPHPSG